MTDIQEIILKYLCGYFVATHGDWTTREDIILSIYSDKDNQGSFLVNQLDQLVDLGFVHKKLFMDRHMYRVTDMGLIINESMHRSYCADKRAKD